MSPRMDDTRGRFPRGLLSNAPPPRSLDQARADRNLNIFGQEVGNGASYRRADFTAGPCYLPPDETPPRPWRWRRDPLVWGAIIGLAAVLGLFFWVTP